MLYKLTGFYHFWVVFLTTHNSGKPLRQPHSPLFSRVGAESELPVTLAYWAKAPLDAWSSIASETHTHSETGEGGVWFSYAQWKHLGVSTECSQSSFTTLTKVGEVMPALITRQTKL